MAVALPLFQLETTRKLERLEVQRAQLLDRMSSLGPMSHKRVILQDRLTQLTNKMLRLECELSREVQP